jgi:hypothetical protein
MWQLQDSTLPFESTEPRRSCALDRFANAEVCSAAAEIPGHRIVNVRIGRLGIGRKKCSGGHDLSRLAIAALWHLFGYPGPFSSRDYFRLADHPEVNDETSVYH